MTCKPALPPGEMLSPEGLWQQLQPPLSGGGAVTALGFDSGGGSSIQSFYTPVLMVRHGEMIGFLQVYFICCILQIHFICRIFKHLILKPGTLSEPCLLPLILQPGSGRGRGAAREGPAEAFSLGPPLAQKEIPTRYLRARDFCPLKFYHFSCSFLLLFQRILLKECHEG